MRRNIFTFRPQELLRFFSLILIISIFSSCSRASSKEKGKVGSSAPPFSVTDVDGNKYSLSELEGKVIVLNFWFIGCPPCIREIPELNNLVQKYEQEEVIFLALARDSKSKLKKFLDTKTFEYNIVPRSGWMTNVFNTHGFPTNIIIDTKSQIVFHEAAYDPERVNQMDEIIASLIK